MPAACVIPSMENARKNMVINFLIHQAFRAAVVGLNNPGQCMILGYLGIMLLWCSLGIYKNRYCTQAWLHACVQG